MRIIELVRGEWDQKFNEECELISKSISIDVFKIHHIGSTAIKGILSKPTVDMLMEVSSLDLVDSRNKEFSKIGYEALGEFGIKGRRFFTKGGDERSHHLHVFERGNAEIKKHLSFVDFIKQNPTSAREYEHLKISLAEKYKFDPDSYCDGKNEFFEKILELVAD